MATETELSTTVHAYEAIYRKLLSFKRRQPSENESVCGKSSSRRREFTHPEVIQRLNGIDILRKERAGVKASLNVVENGGNMAVFLVGST